MKRIGCLIMVFLAGFVAALNASALRYGQPEDYGSWYSIAFAICLAVFFGYGAIER